ncbi:uncharacterized protein M6B38_138155 [Iris pallida]|uniref:Transmembrane protein 131-like N-terminal domain-containing protein n=1 Tax=Iris pallida TaxID=29817 RepID=A0AAX6FEB5_IRIPA|nr:uncharacterized protein M6B38_138155 [Iris pallida]
MAMMAVDEDAHPSSETKDRNIAVLFSVLVSVFLVLPYTVAEVDDRYQSVPCARHGWLSDGLQEFRGLSEVQETFPWFSELENACPDSESFCFPSTLVDFGEVSDRLKVDDWSSDAAAVGFCRGLPLLDYRNLNPEGFDSELPSAATYLEINPSSLDWGMSSLLSPALVYLNVTNNHNSSMLHVLEPFITDEQFYAYSFNELLLAPGEAGLIAFVFLPRFLGSISAQIVLQTNFGGFIVQCKGIGVESSYGVEPFGGFDVSSDGRLTWNFSLYNHFEDGLYVEEVSAQVSVYTEHTSSFDNSICSIEVFHQPSRQFGSFCEAGGRNSWTENWPCGQQEVPPQNTETTVKVNLWPPVKGKVSGAICMELWNSRRDKSDTVIVPLEAEVDGRANYNSLSGSVSVFFESLVPWNGRRMVCSLSLRNSASNLLSLIHIAESSKAFEIKYTKGLLLYPGSITRVALISYTTPTGSEDSPTGIPWESFNCKLSVVNNDSVSPQIILPCQELVHACHRSEAVGGLEGSYIGVRYQVEKEKLSNARTGSLEGVIAESLPLKSKFTELLEADRLILRNWKSQGTMSKSSVLKDHELLFPVVQIGAQFSKWITVHNPSESPVIMQLLLNSGTIIDQCKNPDESFNLFLVNMSRRETQDGFSLLDSATTEAFVQPFGSAQLGPVLFQPSNQCRWSSSALIRNNLSGIEWLSLRAFGGSYSLLLLEGSKPVNKIEFNLPLPLSLNLASPYSLINMKTTCKSCDHQLYKELYAKNAGELPLEVTNLEVSGTNCGMDGFMIHSCKGFSLEPGESVKLLISYQPDFSAALVLRNLTLIMFSGVLAIPMEASLPVSLINLCKKSLLWTATWKLFAPVFTAVSIVCLLLFILLHPTSSGNEGFSIKSEATIATISKVQKPSRIQRNARNARSNKKDEKSEEGMLISRYSHNESCVQGNAQKTKENKDTDHQQKSTSQSPHSTKMLARVPDSCNTSEASHSGNLTVMVVKERGRRRKKRATGGGLAPKLEVSSSQSGNSTPSSPMSPNAFALNSSYSSFSGLLEEQKQQNKQDFSLPMETKVQEPQKSSRKPVLSTSATFPTSGWRAPGSSTSNLASASPIAPYARAPGSKLSKEETMKRKEEDVFGRDFTYDIWGNHFCDHLIGNCKDFSPKVFDASEGDSQSFFARDPQSLMMMSSAHSVSPGHKLLPYNVDYLNEMK